MVEAVMYFYTLYLLTLLTQVASSIMSYSESRLASSVSCPKIADFVCSIDSDSVSQDDLNSYDIPCPPPHHFMQFCDTNVGHLLTCKIKLHVIRYCYGKYSNMYLPKVCVNCSCDDRCNEVNGFMIQKGFLEYTSDQAYSSTTSKSRSSIFSFAISGSTTDLSKVSTGISVTENVTDILRPCISSTSSDSNGTYIIMTTLEAKMQLKDSEQIAFEYFIILPAIFIIEAIVLILIYRYRRKYRQRPTISSNRPEEDADPNICRVSSTERSILYVSCDKTAKRINDIDGLAGSDDELAGSDDELATLVKNLDEISSRFDMEISAEKTNLMTNSGKQISKKIKVRGFDLTFSRKSGSIILQFTEPRLEHVWDPTVYNVPMDNPVYKGSNSLESEGDRNIFEDYDKWRYIDDSRSVSSM